VGTGAAGLNQFEPTSGTFRHYRYDPNVNTSLSGDEIMAIQEAPNGDLWIGTAVELSRLDPQTGLARRYSISTGDQSAPGVLMIYVDRKGTLWVGTNQGLDRFDEQTGKFTNYHHIPALPDSLDNNVILSIYEDREGVLWVGTYGGGINWYNPALDKFAFYRNDPENSNSLINDVVFGFYIEPSGITWIGTVDGLDRLDPATGKYTHFQHDPTQTPKNSGPQNSISDNMVWSILRDSQGKLWIATHNGLNQFD
jgi:ligand-binding sensor domain-containing protein